MRSASLQKPSHPAGGTATHSRTTAPTLYASAGGQLPVGNAGFSGPDVDDPTFSRSPPAWSSTAFVTSEPDIPLTGHNNLTVYIT